MAAKTAILSGTPYISPVGVNAGEALGNTSKITVTITTEKKELPNYQGGGGNDDSFEKFKSGTITLACRHVSLATLTKALGATAVSVAAGAVADEAHTVVALDRLIALDHLQDMSVAIEVTNDAGTTTYAEGTHYLRKRAGIIPLTAVGGMAVDDDIKISYTKSKHARFQALVNLIQESSLLFDGLNERSNKPWMWRFHRISWGPAKSLELVGEDFASFDMDGEILAWDGITETGKSQFYEALVGDL